MKFKNSAKFLFNVKHLESSRPRHRKQQGAAHLGSGSPSHQKQRGAEHQAVDDNAGAMATAETTLTVAITEEMWRMLYSLNRQEVWKENLKQKYQQSS